MPHETLLTLFFSTNPLLATMSTAFTILLDLAPFHIHLHENAQNACTVPCQRSALIHNATTTSSTQSKANLTIPNQYWSRRYTASPCFSCSDTETYILDQHKQASGAMRNLRSFRRATFEGYIHHMQLTLTSQNSVEPTTSRETSIRAVIPHKKTNPQATPIVTLNRSQHNLLVAVACNCHLSGTFQTANALQVRIRGTNELSKASISLRQLTIR